MAVNVNGQPLSFVATLDDKDFNKVSERIKAEIGSVTKAVVQQQTEIAGLARTAAAGIAGFFTVNAAKNFVQQMISVRGEFQQLEATFGVMLKSKTQADALMKDLVQFAATTPFSLKDTASSAKQLLAYGSSAQDVTKELRMLGDVAAATSTPIGDIVYLYGTLRTQGRAYSQDIRQFAGRGIPIYEELAKVLGTTKDKVNEFVESGKVGFPEVQKAIQNMTAEGGKFSGTMEAASKTIAGQISNLGDTIDQMFNAIGKSNEGIISEAISGVSYLVEHYEEIGKILAVLVTTYGAYRAALIATAAVQQVQMQMALGQVGVLQGVYAAVVRATQGLRTMMASMNINPYVLAATALTALITTLVLFNKKAQEGKDRAQLLAEANEKAGNKIAEMDGKIRPYLQQLNKANLSEADRIRIYNELQKIDPKIVKGLDAKTLSYQKLSVSVKEYLDNLRQQFALEANQTAIIESIRQEQDIKKKLDAAKQEWERDSKALEELRKSNNGFAMQGYSGMASAAEKSKTRVGELVIALNKQIAATQQLGEEQAALNKKDPNAPDPIKDLKYWQGIAEAAKKAIEAMADSEKGTAKWNEQKKIYDDAQQHIEAYNLSSKQATKAAIKAEDEYIEMLRKKAAAVVQIGQVQADYNKRYLDDVQLRKAEIDERYDAEIKHIRDVNAEIEKYNKTAGPGKQIALIPQSDIDKINTTRTNAKTDVDTVAASKQELDLIKQKQAVYDEYAKAVKAGNVELAASIAQQYDLKGFKTYTEYIESEYNKLLAKRSKVGIEGLTEGERQKLKELEQEFKNLNTQAGQDNLNGFIDARTKALEATELFAQKQAAIEKKKNDTIAELDKLYADKTNSRYQERVQIAVQTYEDETNALQLAQWQNSKIYRTISADLTLYTKQELQKRLEEIRKFTKSDEFNKLGEGQKKKILEALDEAEAGIKVFGSLSDETRKQLQQSAEWMGVAASAFSDLANAIGDSNAGLADTLNTASQLLDIGVTLVSAILSGNPAQIIGAAIKVVTSVIGMFAAARKSAIEAQKQIDAFNNQQYLAEFKINELLRQRLVMQADEIELTLAKIKAQKQALLLSQQQAKTDEAQLLATLQNEQYISGMTTEKYGGFLGLARKTRAVNQYGSLLGMTYEQIEKLYESGKLDGKAKDLFEQLKKVHEGGADIDKQLKELQKQASEIWTGTTADSILDSITQGFADGLKTAGDFADNFEDMMRQAMINSLKYKYLEPFINDFYKQFAEFAQSDEVLTQAEIEELKRSYNSMIADVGKQFDQLQQVTGISVASAGNTNSLTGAIKGMTEQTAEIIGGNIGGLRMTAIDQLNVATRSLQVHQQIEMNTRNTAGSTAEMFALLRRIELNGLKVK